MSEFNRPLGLALSDQLGPTAPKPCAWLVAGHLLDCGDDQPAVWAREPTAADRETWAQCGVTATVTPLHGKPTPEAVAWALAEEVGDDPGHLIWEGNPPEPWGEVWCRYMPQAERLVKRLFGA